MRGPCLVLTIVLLVPAAVAEERNRDETRVPAWKPVDVPLKSLGLANGVELVESSRSLRDSFPYLLAARKERAQNRGTRLTPKTLREFLHRAPQKGGTVPAAIRTGEQALAVVRLFVAGPLVRDRAQAERIIAEAKKLQADLKHLKPKVHPHRPKSYEPRATPLDQDKSVHPVEAWGVSMVAFEMDGLLQLVHVQAKVRANGEISIQKKPIVVGPMTSWQTGVVAGGEEPIIRKDREMREDAVVARRRYASALGLGKDLDTGWALVRTLDTAQQLRDCWGRSVPAASGVRRGAFLLNDGTAVTFTQGLKGRFTAADQVEYVKGPMDVGARIHRLRR